LLILWQSPKHIIKHTNTSINNYNTNDHSCHIAWLILMGFENWSGPAHANTRICLQNGDLINSLLRKEKKPKGIEIYLHLSTKLWRCKRESCLAVDEGKLSNSCSNTLVPRREHTGTQGIRFCVGPTVLIHTALKRENPAVGGIKPQPSNP
jgi:hypothetical protein